MWQVINVSSSSWRLLYSSVSVGFMIKYEKLHYKSQYDLNILTLHQPLQILKCFCVLESQQFKYPSLYLPCWTPQIVVHNLFLCGSCGMYRDTDLNHLIINLLNIFAFEVVKSCHTPIIPQVVRFKLFTNWQAV